MREWLIAARKAKGLTQKQVAERIGVCRPYYAQMELGYRDITLKKARLLCIALEIPWSIFFEKE